LQRKPKTKTQVETTDHKKLELNAQNEDKHRKKEQRKLKLVNMKDK